MSRLPLRPVVLALAGLCALSPPAPAQGKKYALLVGVGEYDHPQIRALKYTGNDIKELGEVLAHEGGYEVVVLRNGEGVTADAKGAFVAYGKACDGGNLAPGCQTLGESYLNGWGVDKDPVKATAIFQTLCDKKQGDGCFMLGYRYRGQSNLQYDAVTERGRSQANPRGG